MTLGGRNDTTYSVRYQEEDSDDVLTAATSIRKSFSTIKGRYEILNYTCFIIIIIIGLRPGVGYYVYVSAENGASSVLGLPFFVTQGRFTANGIIKHA